MNLWYSPTLPWVMHPDCVQNLDNQIRLGNLRTQNPINSRKVITHPSIELAGFKGLSARFALTLG